MSDFAAASGEDAAAGRGRNDEADSGRREEGHEAAEDSLQHHLSLLFAVYVCGCSVEVRIIGGCSLLCLGCLSRQCKCM